MNETIRFSLDHLASVNYASYHNSLNIIRRLHIENHGEEDISDAVLTIAFVPEVSQPLSLAIPRLPGKKSVDLGKIDQALSAEFILSLTEAVKVVMSLTLSARELSVSEDYPLMIHPFDQWPGYEDMPEILAAYALPGHPAVKNLLVRSGELLQGLTGSGSFLGYRQSDPNQVLREVSAIFSAVAELKTAYIAPARDYARMGKRVRLVDEVLEKGFGDGLDLSLLLASVLEAAGLNPLLMIFEEECLTGVWLKEEVFPETVNYDSSAVAKRTARGMNQIAVFDPREVLSDGSADFQTALAKGAQILNASEDFVLSLDLKRARLAGIRALPVRVLEDGRYVLDRRQSGAAATAALPEELAMVEPDGPAVGEVSDRQKVWERKLLDLSLRNSLLNFRPERNGLPLVIADLEAFAGDLQNEVEFNILNRPADWTQPVTPGKGLPTAWLDLAREEYPSRRLRSLLDAETMDERGTKLAKSARSSLEETGANSLYIGLGFLRWTSRQDPETFRQAPLILIPVDCETKGHLAGLLLRMREEDAHFNITLIEMLKKDYGILLSGLDPLPMKGEAIDVLKVFSKVRAAIMREKHWDVEETAGLGLFSFAKFMMWSDLTQNMDQFKKSKMVDSLLAGNLTFPLASLELEERFLDDVPLNQAIIYPVSSDASQSQAVLASAAGRSFVLHGPPGTGKSQTITNIIANALMQDKRVLFVAQKMAALEVVEKRLNDIGIGSFCLELHSNKARKKAVLDQLENSMKIQRIPKDPDFEKDKQALRAQKAELNEVVRRLYEVDASGWSIYDLITEQTKLESTAKYIDLPGDFAADRLKDQTGALVQLAKLGAHAGGPYGHPLRAIGHVDYQTGLREDIAAGGGLALEGPAQTLAALVEADHELAPATYAQVIALARSLRAVVDALTLNSRLLLGDPQTTLDQLIKLKEHLTKTQSLRDELLSRFDPSFLAADPHRLERDYNLFAEKNVLGRLFRKNPVEKEMALYSRSGLAAPSELKDQLASLADYQSQAALAQTARADLQGLVAATEELSPSSLEPLMESLRQVLAAVGESGQLEALTLLCQRPEIARRLSEHEVQLARISPDLERLLKLTAFQETELAAFSGNYFQRFSSALAQLVPALDGLRDWLMYRQAKESADQLGLAPFTAYYHDGHVSEGELIPVFQKSVVRCLLKTRLEGEKLLLNTTGQGLDEKARDLKERIAEMERLERKELYFHLGGKVPNLVLERATSQEIAILQRALRSGARNLSIRKLFAETDNLLRRIAPCMLMSPMSVAQYLKPEADLFDLVVFDEASQIPTPEAIGALGRAREAIIVGDPKQLPPTSFFMTQNNGSEEQEEFQDLDNILEDALALSMPESYLLWHYRSRHESLIAFSNRNFYDGKLYTYPSPDDMVSKVSLVRNQGVYERGNGRVNRLEAAAVVDEVIRRIQDPLLVRQSIGIVTFSVVQQALIEDLLKEKIQGDETLKKALEELPEELFVKNLENVQGDERDVILFSVGYGPDEQGRLTMNFGPLNQEGGWRRLNVAVSRSRREMMVFTNIDPLHFNVPASSARGVRELKAFLEFAQSGTRTVTLEELRHESEVENLNSQIAEGLRERGWKVETDIGTSRFKVDLAMVDPRDPDRFLLGILCGGESVRQAGAAYDREVLQRSVLHGLGWQIHRVFAMDWLENKEKVLDGLVSRAEDLLKTGRTTPEEGAPGELPLAVSRQIPYQRHQLKARKLMMDEFLNVANASTIGQDLLAIIKAEGPITRRLLAIRASGLYELSRVTPKMEQHMELILNKVRPVVTLSGEIPVYWDKAVDPAAFDHFRKTLPDDPERRLADIAPSEVLSAMRELLVRPLPSRQLLRESAALLGYPQMNIDNENFLGGLLNVALLEGQFTKSGQDLVEAIPSETAEADK